MIDLWLSNTIDYTYTYIKTLHKRFVVFPFMFVLSNVAVCWAGARLLLCDYSVLIVCKLCYTAVYLITFINCIILPHLKNFTDFALEICNLNFVTLVKSTLKKSSLFLSSETGYLYGSPVPFSILNKLWAQLVIIVTSNCYVLFFGFTFKCLVFLESTWMLWTLDRQFVKRLCKK